MPNTRTDRRGLFTEFDRVAREAASSAAFSTRFEDASRAGDRSQMVGHLLSNLDYSPKVREFFRGKDENRAQELVEVSMDEDAPDETIPSILTEALMCVPSRSHLFFEIVALRARAWARLGDAKRGISDCRLFDEVISEMRDEDFMEKRRVDMLLLHADCCKAQGNLCEYRSWLNEAMRRIEKLAKKLCNTGKTDEFRSRKAEVLNEFLERKQKVADDRPEDPSEQLKVPELPAVDGRVNEFLTSCSDAVALGKDNKKGRMLVATRSIKPGSVLIVERPYAFTTDFFALNRNCLNCHVSFKLPGVISVPCKSCRTVQFCSEDCRKRAWDKYHQYECRVFDYFFDKKLQKTSSLLAYRTVVTATALYVQDSILELDRGFLQAHENDKKILDVKTLKRYESQDYRTVSALETHCGQADPKDNLEKTINSIFLAHCLLYAIGHYHPELGGNLDKHLQIFAVALFHNMQMINCNAYEIVENVRDNETKILEPRNVGGAIYSSVSLTNHSCYPNIVRHSYPNGTVVVKSIRFIPQGGEILDCYGQHFLENDKESRQKLLEQKYNFECQCQACMREWPMKLPSDVFNFKCKSCSKRCRRTRTHAECATCNQKTEISKFYALLQNSIKKRLSALTRMYDGNYADALPLLLEHANCIDKILAEPSLEAVKTQQSIIQCFNAMSSTSI